MDSIEVFPVKKLVQIIRRARRVAQVSFEGPEGWAKSSVDPMRLLSVFKPLRLKDGVVLRAYQFRSGGNGNGVVYAMPEDAPFPEPDECERDRRYFLDPPVPPGALGDVMEAIEGDCSLWSYLLASLFARELAESGAMWHGCNWSTHEILGRNPLSRPPEGSDLPQSALLADIDPRAWNWLEPEPKQWQPTVAQEGDLVTVTFYTYSGLGKEAIYRHIDRYRRQDYRFETKNIPIAEGQGGFLF